MTMKATELHSQQALGNATVQPDPPLGATGHATEAQPRTLKALADAVLGRNRSRNRSATEAVESRNLNATSPASGGAFGIAPSAPQPDPAAEARRSRVLAMLDANPGARYAVVTDTQADPEAVILTLAIRGQVTCEFLIPKAKYNPFLLLDLIERHGGTTH